MAWRTGSALMATALLAVAWVAPTTTLADPGQAGRIAGGIGAQGFDPSASYRTATQALGLQDARTSGELGGEVGIQVTQQQQRSFRCRDGARITAGGVRVSIESCEQSQNGSLSTLSVSVCDALTQGIGCTDERYTAVQQVPPGGEATFTGGLLTGTYRVSADCNSNECEMTMHQLHGDAWGGHDMRNQASQRVDATDGHPINAIRDVRNDPVFGAGENFANNRAHCLGGQFDQLFTEGDIPVSCNPDDPRSIDFLDIDGNGQCEPDVLETDLCIVNIPTQIVTCEPDSRECDVQRETAEFVCERKREVQVVGTELECTPFSAPCVPGASSCCSFRLTCNNAQSADIRYEGCVTGVVWNRNVTLANLAQGVNYNANPGSIIRCNSNGHCSIDWGNVNGNHQPIGDVRYNVHSFTLRNKNVYEDFWIDSCGDFEERMPDVG
ncbi:MAG: hypothetical protein CL484_14425 [Acidobacteria bacterium]|jgi:hypothetical protein|nr:hypothetical protein [Acidobacteriota bacterium]